MIPLADLKAHLRVTHTHDDGYIAELEEAAVAHVSRYTGRYFGQQSETTEHVLGSGTDVLWLSAEPVVGAQTPVTVAERSVPGITPTQVDDFEVRGRKLLRTGGGVWARGWGYAVTYTRGYAEGAEPENVRHAVKMLVAHWYTNRTSAVTATNALRVPDGVRDLLGGPRTRV